MSEAKFTKGPWGRTTFANGQPRVYRIGRDYKEADIAHTHGSDDVANADLIAAAPEMYEAMQEFVNRVDRGEVRSTATYNKFKTILAKARGEI